jgi:hypothetical protein
VRSETRRFTAALCAYAVLALMAALTLTGIFRVVVWICLGAFAVKTWIASVRQS